ncbi:Tryptophan synthase alpha chain [Geodia barretti]|uniref:tryptophan synthase n=1 Tax=Geodia barretti TaxID=519541 RepID=A0AA35VXI2_GEOBA|nr:Tryptophan synthase alpha chain [Geodia barretti]
MSLDRIKEKFESIKREGRPGLIVYLTTGFPDLEATLELVPALAEAGADGIELSIPFSDPLADGPVIQESSYHALQRGVTPDDCLELVSKVRGKVPDTPLILMTYYNPVHSYGLEQFAQRLMECGIDGVIPVDVPAEEAGPLYEQCAPRGIHIVPLLAPTSTDKSIKTAVSMSSGFIYCVSVTGITGTRDQVSQRGLGLLQRVRQFTSLPLAVGFGISRREHVETVCQEAEAAAVGSALIRTMLESPRNEVVERSSKLVADLAGRSWPPSEGREL